jgi:hypothetical protein
LEINISTCWQFILHQILQSRKKLGIAEVMRLIRTGNVSSPIAKASLSMRASVVAVVIIVVENL